MQFDANCALSWDGKNVYGDENSIKFVKNAIHEAGTVPELKERIRQMQAKIDSLESNKPSNLKKRHIKVYKIECP